MEEKKSYVKPLIVSLDKVGKGLGEDNCLTGSSADMICDGNGNSAGAMKGCWTNGNAAQTACNSDGNEVIS